LNVTAVVCNFKTKELIHRCVESFRVWYPDLGLIIVDDGSRDRSTEYIQRLSEGEWNTTAIIRKDNRGHGPSLNLGISHVHTRYVFTMDSDCTFNKAGFLEKMLERFHAEPKLFAIGKRVLAWKKSATLYVRPAMMMMDRKKFLKLKPFIHHGAPALETMIDAQERGFLLEDFPILDYVNLHGGSGTRTALGKQIEAGEVSYEEFSRWQPHLRGYFEVKMQILKGRLDEDSSS